MDLSVFVSVPEYTPKAADAIASAIAAAECLGITQGGGQPAGRSAGARVPDFGRLAETGEQARGIGASRQLFVASSSMRREVTALERPAERCPLP